MHDLLPRRRLRILRGQGGFTVVEVLTAVGILAVGLVALVMATGWGMTDVDAARRSTTALFLAEQRMEEIKAFAQSKGPSKGWRNVDAAHFPTEPYGSIADYGDYRRAVVVTPNTVIPPETTGSRFAKQVEVRVYYRPATATGIGPETAVSVSTILVWR